MILCPASWAAVISVVWASVEFWRAEAKRLTVENVVLQTRVADLEGQVGALAEKVSVLARLAFGTSSEKAKRAPGGDGTAGGARR